MGQSKKMHEETMHLTIPTGVYHDFPEYVKEQITIKSIHDDLPEYKED